MKITAFIKYLESLLQLRKEYTSGFHESGIWHCTNISYTMVCEHGSTMMVIEYLAHVAVIRPLPDTPICYQEVLAAGKLHSDPAEYHIYCRKTH